MMSNLYVIHHFPEEMKGLMIGPEQRSDLLEYLFDRGVWD